MKKINWFARLFMSYNALKDHFGQNDDTKINTTRLETELEGIKKQLTDKEMHLNDLRKQLEDNKSLLNEKLQEFTKLSAENSSTKKTNNELQNRINDNQAAMREMQQKLIDLDNEKSNLKNSIEDKLKTLSKIDRTFFGSAGNKGKGEMGELQLENLLIQSGLESEFWMKNLMVGSKNVEFAIKSGDNNKWIPVDSKVLESAYDEDNNKMIVDDKYLANIRTQAKKVSEYLGKSETATYGLLVLQNDEVYMSVHQHNPHFFQEMIKDHKIYITSPSSFIQFAWSIAHILEIYEKVHGEEKIYQKILKMMSSTATLAKSLNESFIKMRVSMEKHYPAVVNHHNKVLNAFAKNEKLKLLPNLGEKKAEIEALEADEE